MTAARSFDAQLADILRHAGLAPSGHNAQPWTVRETAPGRLIVGSDRARWLPAVDPANRELLLSLGAFLENLCIAARHHGFEVQYTVLARQPTDLEVLDITLTPAPAVPFPLEKLRTRRTVRRHLLETALATDDVAALAAPFGHRLASFNRGSPEAAYLEQGTIEANRLQADRDDAQGELSRWIRWTKGDGRQHQNGLTPESLEITGISGWYVRHFMNRAAVMKPNFRKRGIATVQGQVGSYGAWLVITSADSAIPTLLETGRAFERMWLGVRERMIAIHPMTQLLEETATRDQVGSRLGLAGVVQFILRAGYVKHYPEPVSLRMPLSSFVSA